jgi:hypothetical protein
VDGISCGWDGSMGETEMKTKWCCAKVDGGGLGIHLWGKSRVFVCFLHGIDMT